MHNLFMNSMIGKKIRQLRKSVQENQAIFGERFEVEQASVSRWEKGEPVQNKYKPAIAALAGMTEVEFFYSNTDPGNQPTHITGFSEDAAEYTIPDGHYLHSKVLPENHFWYEVTGDALSELDILVNDLVEVSLNAADLKAVKSEDVVIIQLYSDDGFKAKTLLRQFIGPNLLITNRKQGNAPSINMLQENAVIMGVVKRVHRDRVL